MFQAYLNLLTIPDPFCATVQHWDAVVDWFLGA